ncbi:hypothetical protein RN001_015063 [Aquatica leii]|uniref:Cytochrome P450 n=1 Tax=Aquatica leii TaxID=1421715 RepID=A0AAN7PP60_9COLE|nr:hypothetical protein RN001_015063 [Aquatica leii]
MNLFIAIILSIILGVIYTFKWSFKYWKKKGVYTQTPYFPFGNAKNIIMQKVCMGVELVAVYNHFKKKMLSFGGFYFLTWPILVPIDLDLIKKILITDFEHFTNHTIFGEDYDPMSQHLLSLKGTEWKKMRSKLAPAFTTSKNKMLFDTVLKCVDNFLKVLDEAAATNKEVDIKELSSRLSADVIASCAFGFEANSLKNSNPEVRNIAMDLFRPSARNTIILLIALIKPKVLSFFKIKLTEKRVAKFFTNLMKETVTYRETNKVIRQDFIHLLLQIKNNVKITEDAVGNFEKTSSATQLTLQEMAAQSMIFFVGGFETISITIMYCLYELAKNTAIQEKARAEIQKCFFENSDVDDKLTYAFIQNLTYTEKVINETLRMYPPVPVHTRQCSKDYIIPNTNVRIEKECLVFIPTLAIHKDPDIYPNPEEFDPERFSPENIRSRHTCTWMPFGVGPRTCIAYQFGLMEIKIVIATLLNRYQFTLNPKTQQPVEPTSKGFLFFPNDKIWINFERL